MTVCVYAPMRAECVAFIQKWLCIGLGSQELWRSPTVGQGRHSTKDHGHVVAPFFFKGRQFQGSRLLVTQVLGVLHQCFAERPPRIS